MSIQQREIEAGHLLTAGASRNEGKGWMCIAGATIVAGDIVVASGSRGSHVEVIQADADIAAKARNLLFVAEHGATVGQQVRCAALRILTAQNTNAATALDLVYLSGTSGAWTLTPGAIPVPVGVVLVKSATVGVVLLCPQSALAAGTEAIANVLDSVFGIVDEADTTKKLIFDVGARISTGQTRTWTAPDRNVKLGGQFSTLNAAGTAKVNTDTLEAVLASVSIGAGLLLQGIRMRVSYKAKVTVSAGMTTLTIKLRMGPTTLTGTVLVGTGAVDTSVNHICCGEFMLTARAAPGAAASCEGWGFHQEPGAVGGAMISDSFDAANFATNGALLLELTGQWSANGSDNSVQAEDFHVELLAG